MPVQRKMTFSELEPHLNVHQEIPGAIPYRTTYYKRDWGFCVNHNQFEILKKEENLEIMIDSNFDEKGNLTIGELIIPGRSKQEILISTYICHPSLANDNLSGMIMTAFLARFLLSKLELQYSYRIIFIPETIGSLVYLSRNLKKMKKNIIAGFNITCVGDEKNYSYLI